MTALEYGCGTGLLSFGLMDDLGQITLADSSDGMLEVLREKIASIGAANMHPLRFDLTVDPPPLERFDLVYNLMTLHHIPDVDGALASFYAMLHAGGWLAICDLDTEDGSFHDPGVDVHHGFDRNDLATRLRNVGFVDIRSLTAHDIQREREGVERRYPAVSSRGTQARGVENRRFTQNC